MAIIPFHSFYLCRFCPGLKITEKTQFEVEMVNHCVRNYQIIIKISSTGQEGLTRTKRFFLNGVASKHKASSWRLSVYFYWQERLNSLLLLDNILILSSLGSRLREFFYQT